MSVTVLGGRRRGCSGPAARRRSKVGALSLMGGLFNTSSLLAADRTSPREYTRPVKAKSVVLLYLQGGPPTQDMWDLKPQAPNGVGGEFKPIATSAPGVEIGELLPLSARWMHKSSIVRSVYHNGGCHKNLPMYTGFDVNLPDEEFRESDPPSMGSVCAYLKRDQNEVLPTYAYLPCSLGWGEGRKKGGPHGGFLGRRYDPFCTECTAFVDHPPDDQWRPQVVRGEPRLTDTQLIEGITLDRLIGRRGLVEQFDEKYRGLMASQPDLGNFPREQRLAFDMLTSAAIREDFDLSREDDRARERYGRTLFGRFDVGWPGGLVERGVQFVNVGLGQLLETIRGQQGGLGYASAKFPDAARDVAAEFRSNLFGVHRRSRRPRTARPDAGGHDGRNGTHAEDQCRRRTRSLDLLLLGALRRSRYLAGGSIYGASDNQAAFIKDKPVHIRDICATIYHLLGIDPEMPVYDRANRPVAIAQGGHPIDGILA